MTQASLFNRGAAVVRDLDHVRVDRLVLEQGGETAPIIVYHKTFKPTGWDIWRDREQRFLNLFDGSGLKHVVQVRAYDRDHQAVYLRTMDAGLTIEEWLGVGGRYADGTPFKHPFLRGEDFLRLLRACLDALRDIHALGVVHCDIKEDNICLPYVPQPYRAGELIRPDLDSIRLIDFSFSLGPSHTLKAPLPIDPRHPNSVYLSPLLRDALSAATQEEQLAKLSQLDYRVDLYSLGYMARKIMDSGRFIGDTEERGVSGKTLARELIDEMMEMGAGRRLWRHLLGGLPHDNWIDRLDKWLLEAKPQEGFHVLEEREWTAQDGTPITPMLTPITPTKAHTTAENTASAESERPAVATNREEASTAPGTGTTASQNGGASPPPEVPMPPEPPPIWRQPKIVLPIILLGVAGMAATFEWLPAPEPASAPPQISASTPPPPAQPPREIYFAQRDELAKALSPAGGMPKEAFGKAVEQTNRYAEHGVTEARTLLMESVEAWGSRLEDDKARLDARREAFRRLERIAATSSGQEMAAAALRRFELAWNNHQGRQTQLTLWFARALVLAGVGRVDATLPLAEAMWKGTDLPLDRGRALRVYTELQANTKGDGRVATAISALVNEIIQQRDGAAVEEAKAYLARLAGDLGEGNAAILLGELNACALNPPDLDAARAAYEIATRGTNRQAADVARKNLVFLEAGRPWCRDPVR